MGRGEIVAQSASQAADYARTAHYTPGITIRRAIDRAPGLERRRDGSHVAWLSPEEHRQLWRGIQRQAPLLAAFIQGDIAQRLRDVFDAELVLGREEMRGFMEAGAA
jgi:hypothetical protein